MTKPLIFMGVGDIILGDPPNPASLFEEIAPTLAEADILFAQNETSYSRRGDPVPQNRGRLCYDPANIQALAGAGIDVMSVCSNHSVDYGHKALLDTIQGIRDAGILAVGAGANVDEARTYAVIERDGVKLALLAYSPACDKSYNANAVKPGNNPMAVYTYYQEIEPDFPGAKPMIHTFPDLDHVATMRADIARAKTEADVVVVSFHWGLPFEPVTLARYESELGKIAIDSGADLIVGHHQHVIKAVETYKGKVIFHGINRFCLWIKLPESHYNSPTAKLMREKHGDAYLKYNPASSNPFAADSNDAMIVRAEFTKAGLGEVAFIPCVLDPVTSVPRRATPGDGNFERIVELTKSVTEKAGIHTEFEVVDDRVRVIAEK